MAATCYTRVAMAPRARPPFRADHVGSLLRPPELHARGTIARPAASTRRSCARSRTTRSARPCRCRRTSACGRRPTASSAAPPGTWTSSTGSDGDHEGGRRASPSSSTTRRATSSVTPAALHVDGKLGVSTTIFGDDFAFLRDTVTTARAEADDPVAEHGPLPRRPGRDRPSVYPDLDSFWADLTAAYRGGGAPARRARLHVPPARRHEPRLPERPAPARVRRARSAAIPTASTSSTSATSTRRSPAGRRAWP